MSNFKFTYSAKAAHSERQDLDWQDEEADHVSIFTPLIAGVIGGAIVGGITRGLLRMVFGRE